MKKGAFQIDYIIAAGLFILILGLVTQYIVNYYSTMGEYSRTISKTGDAQSLMNINEWTFTPDTWPQTSQDPSIVLLLHLNNQSGENGTFFKDFSGNGNNGTCSGTSCPIYNSSGKFYSAYTFDGINDNINLGPARFNQTFTISFWTMYYGNPASNYNVLFGNEAYLTNGFRLGIAGSSPTFKFWTTQSGGTISVQTLNVLNNTWYHFAVTFNGTTAKLYRNGEMVAQGDGTYVYSANTLYISGGAGGVSKWNGTIDEVVIYNRSLSADEIQQQYNYGLRLLRIGMKTTAYRFFITANNTNPYYYNKSMSVTDLTNEIVSFDYAKIGYTTPHSMKIYDDSNNVVGYSVTNNSIVSFVTNISANQAKGFTVYFDNDVYFKDSAVAVTGSDYINQTLYPIEQLDIISYDKMSALSNANYSAIKNATNTTNNFRIRILDTSTNSYVMTLGNDPPRSGDIIAQQKYVVFQNATGDIKQGKMLVQVW